MDAIVLVWGVGSKDPTYDAVVRRGLPAVIGEGRRQPGAPTVALADRTGTAEVGRHLTELGHRKIAVVTLPFGRSERSGPVDGRRLKEVDRTPTKRRLAGLKDAGIVPSVIWEAQASLVEHGHEAGTAILDVPASERPTAVVAQSDLLAAGVLLAARELGIAVPAELSIAGFDGVDLPWLGEERLTSVKQPFIEKGAALGRAAVALAAGETVEDVELPVELVIGTTTGPVPTTT
jgi:DNA-binding LacI/PurR family transcriptional regulator